MKTNHFFPASGGRGYSRRLNKIFWLDCTSFIAARCYRCCVFVSFVLIAVSGGLLLCACGEPKTQALDAAGPRVTSAVAVETMSLQRSVFYKELISNGKLSASQKAELKFRVAGQLSEIYVRHGQHVKQGQVIATLEALEFEHKLEQIHNQLKKASFELQDMLVGRGFDLSDSLNIPKSIYEMSAFRSGYSEAMYNYKTAGYNLSNTKLHAPFDGKIADIRLRDHNYVKENDPFCTLINDRSLVVEFYVLESEIGFIAIGDRVKVRPIVSSDELTGKIFSMNPSIDANGLILVQCAIDNNGSLIDGMNVTVQVQKPIAGQIVVPKIAVVLRDEQKVVFRFSRGKAYWVYIETVDENSGYYSIRAHPTKAEGELNEGDTIIISGNENLAHDTDVLLSTHHSKPLAVKRW